jgi:VanZ family protein
LSSSAVPEPMPSSFLRRLLAWLPTLLWLSVLASFSTDLFSAEHTSGVLWKIIHALYGDMPTRQFQAIHFLVRKTAHFGSYGVLGVFAFYSWRASLPARPRWMPKWSVLALLLTLTAACLDEFHQSFVPSRTASPRDVMLDMMGAVFFQVVIASFTSLSSSAARSKKMSSTPNA